MTRFPESFSLHIKDTLCYEPLFLLVVIIQDDTEATELSQTSEAMMRGRSLDSIPSTFTNGSSSPGPNSMHDQVFNFPYIYL